MAAGILSTAAGRAGEDALSIVLLAVGVAALLVTLAVDLRAWKTANGASVNLVLLTWVAGCAALSDRLIQVSPPASTLFAALAFAGAVGAVGALARSASRGLRAALRSPVTGSWLLASVALQSLSILLSGASKTFSGVLCALGIVVYVFVISLIVRRVVRHSVRIHELTPDYWIMTGALAISTVALHELGAGVAILAWLGAVAWLPFLCAAEAMRVRTRGITIVYDAARWSTVFPVGMLSVATYDVAAVTAVSALDAIAKLIFWVGFGLALSNVGAFVAASARGRGGLEPSEPLNRPR